MVAIDGRLDDRGSLLARLGRGISKSASDGQLLAHAVDRWGAGFVNHLVGDFAIVVADVVGRRVICVRDHLGIKPLYYASIGPLFVAASEVSAVLAHPAVSDEVDPAAVDAWMRHWNVPEGTIYRSVFSLPMASTLVVTLNGITRPVRYWYPSCEPGTWRRPEDLVEEYRHLVREATRDRLRSKGPVVVAMSGGLDSTTVASVAVALSDGEPGLPEVRIASLVYPGHPLIDESSLIDAMEPTLDRTIRRVRPSPRTPAELAAEIVRYRELPDVPNDQFDTLIRPQLDERVLLTGLGGDDWFYASPGLDITRALRHGRLLRAARDARRGRVEGRFETTAGALWRYGVRPLPRLLGPWAHRYPGLARPAALLGGAAGSRLLRATWCPAGVPLDTAPLLSWSRSPLLAGQLAVLERRAGRHGFEHRHPLHDVRLVELALRLPGALRTQAGDSRWLPRRAAPHSIPDVVRLRREKAEFSLPAREELELADPCGLVARATKAMQDPVRSQRDWLEIQRTDLDAWHPKLFGLWSAVAAQIGCEGPMRDLLPEVGRVRAAHEEAE